MMAVLIVEPIRHIAHSLNIKALEWVMSLGAALFGYALLQPGSTFGLSPSYDVIAASLAYIHGTEETMGWSIVILAIIRFVILGINGLWKASPSARCGMSAAYALLWFFVFFGMWNAVGFASTGTGIYLALMVGELINMARTAYEWGLLRKTAAEDTRHEPHTGH
ncbi:hypothetical protein [Antarcticirhabdus aurantiaca]|uniref:Uncharacterized protein n=1 Tax=Antarcticirhabdus aurantiaca TaxID=2606717 RepID=A0ACD4NL57_9HYPH|nr:hypothetical protein [Antarcticirhabdus aurantiaca]WAJ27523.1 hypothetical protein OXU80_22180 [Jeongeuplla avenae]